jgi:hypothetical protein
MIEMATGSPHYLYSCVYIQFFELFVQYPRILLRLFWKPAAGTGHIAPYELDVVAGKSSSPLDLDFVSC